MEMTEELELDDELKKF